MNFWLLFSMTTENWTKRFNESMNDFYKKYYGDLISEEQAKNHETIPPKSRLRIEWLRPGNRFKFLNDFLVKNVTKGFFDGTQWTQISQLISELKKQRKLSKIGFNSLKLAARVVGVNYSKAKKFMREIPRSMQKRWSLGRIIPKLSTQNKVDRLKFCKAFDDETLRVEDLIISG